MITEADSGTPLVYCPLIMMYCKSDRHCILLYIGTYGSQVRKPCIQQRVNYGVIFMNIYMLLHVTLFIDQWGMGQIPPVA